MTKKYITKILISDEYSRKYMYHFLCRYPQNLTVATNNNIGCEWIVYRHLLGSLEVN